MCYRFLGGHFREKPNVKMGKAGGGGSDVEKRQEVKVHSPDTFPETSCNLSNLHGSVLRWSNFLW
jgi:hypothetical protein